MYSICFYFADKPEVQILNKRISQIRGRETIISCDITSSPRGLSLIRKGTKRSRSNSNYRLTIFNDEPNRYTLSLRIISIKEKDYGEYTCYAEKQTWKRQQNHDSVG